MSYEYVSENRLESPQRYMYTPFGGKAFLRDYKTSRHEFIGGLPLHLDLSNTWICAIFLFVKTQNLQEDFDDKDELASLFSSSHDKTPPWPESELNQHLHYLDVVPSVEAINTRALLESLLSATFLDRFEADVFSWAERFVHRFEVNKKICSEYTSELKNKGDDNKNVFIYWLFAAWLACLGLRTKRLKYLNTLLKVSDLLCSLPPDRREGELPTGGLALVLRLELAAVTALMAEKGVRLGTS